MHAGEKWWSSQFLLPGSSQPLSKAQQIAVTHAIAAWAEAVDELPRDAAGTTADHLRVAWRRLLASGRAPEELEELAQRAWRWREHLQRAMDGCNSTAEQRWAGGWCCCACGLHAWLDAVRTEPAAACRSLPPPCLCLPLPAFACPPLPAVPRGWHCMRRWPAAFTPRCRPACRCPGGSPAARSRRQPPPCCCDMPSPPLAPPVAADPCRRWQRD